MGDALAGEHDPKVFPDSLVAAIEKAIATEEPSAGIPEPNENYFDDLELPERSDIAEAVGLLREYGQEQRGEKEEVHEVCSASWSGTIPVGTPIVNSWTTTPRGPLGEYREVTVLRFPGGAHGVSRAVWHCRHAYIERFELFAETTIRRSSQDIKAEMRARRKLRTLVGSEMYERYLMSDHILERSKRSGLIYLIRKNHPTLAIRVNEETDKARVLVALCLHPLGYYRDTFAGVLVPTDDVIAHLLMIRTDERRFWAKSGHHHPPDPRFGF